MWSPVIRQSSLPRLLKFYNFASPFVRTLRNVARQSLCVFWKFCIFARKISRRVIHARQFVFLKTVNDKTVIFEKRHEKIDKNDSLSLTVFFLSNSLEPALCYKYRQTICLSLCNLTCQHSIVCSRELPLRCSEKTDQKWQNKKRLHGYRRCERIVQSNIYTKLKSII